ncbi:MAG: translation initiation factor IF-1 [Candidatus Harrisonbacteria bacterium CG10_big_fil_rev_8_21_14_0_10_42_17]|uniref:Translation initiation factor IF-1 n=1 Tax=Candidatus Harrisonbacteria bacterium CG10_big_fil_rev_8_21_14_0_10_42_17 TaxID=1974584 RepID=A0A2M6WHV9_9BACT|nr:MAG: translation initiation factor IF-1 [Candidatus Harrisonbacteria bacterium CG10_big_fil_rev_8_21_14_0_10_42_17]
MTSDSNRHSKETKKIEGVVEEALPSTTFRVRLSTGETILAHLKGKLRLYRIKVLPGDNVIVEITPYDQGKGRIIRRL